MDLPVIDVFTSFDQIRKNITDNLLQQLGLSETDLHRGTYIAYLIDIISHLTANVLFFSSMNYRESFMTLAQLPESVYALAAFLGYKPTIAIPPSVNVLFTIPLDFKNAIDIVLDPGLKLYASDIIYELRNRVDISLDPVNGNYNVIVTDPVLDSKYALPYSIVNNTISFTTIADQKTTQEFDFVTPSDIKVYEFTNYNISFLDQLAGIDVYVNGELWTEFDSMYLMRPLDKGYVVRLNEQGATVYFGNGIFGQQLPKNVPLKIIITTTKGTDGAVVSKAINACDKVYYQDTSGKKVVKLSVTNLNASTSGQDIENVNEVRRNALIHIQALNRIVSNVDYENIGAISNLPIDVSYPILKRSDLKCNEVTVYTIIRYNQEVVPTRTIPTQELDLKDWTYQPYTPIQFQDYDYYCPFEITPDLDTKFVYYTYYVRHIDLKFTAHNIDLSKYSIVPTRCDLKTNFEASTVDVVVDYTISTHDNIDNYKPVLTISREDISHSYTPEVDNTNSCFKLSIPLSDIPYSKLELQLQIFDQDNNLVGTWTSYAIIKQRLDEVLFSNFTWTDEVLKKGIIHEIPVIAKEWYDNLDEDERVQFEQTILQNFIDGLSTRVYRTLNSSLNIKFADTWGTVIIQKQLELEQSSSTSKPPQYTIDAMYIKNPEQAIDIPDGDYFLISSHPDPTYVNEEGVEVPNPFATHADELAQQTNFIPDVHRVLPKYDYGTFFYSDNSTLQDGIYMIIDTQPLFMQAVINEAQIAFNGNNPIQSHEYPQYWDQYLANNPLQLWDKTFAGTLCKVEKIDPDTGKFYATVVMNDAGEPVGVIAVWTPPGFPVAIDEGTEEFKDWVNYPAVYDYYPIQLGAPNWELFTYEFNSEHYDNTKIFIQGWNEYGWYGFACYPDKSPGGYTRTAVYSTQIFGSYAGFAAAGAPFAVITEGDSDKVVKIWDMFYDKQNEVYKYVAYYYSDVLRYYNGRVVGISKDISGNYVIATTWVTDKTALESHSTGGPSWLDLHTIDGTLVAQEFDNHQLMQYIQPTSVNQFGIGFNYYKDLNWTFPTPVPRFYLGLQELADNKLPDGIPFNEHFGFNTVAELDYVSTSGCTGYIATSLYETSYNDSPTHVVISYFDSAADKTEVVFDSKTDCPDFTSTAKPYVSCIKNGYAYIVYHSSEGLKCRVLNIASKQYKDFSCPNPDATYMWVTVGNDGYTYCSCLTATAELGYWISYFPHTCETYRVSSLAINPEPDEILKAAIPEIKALMKDKPYLNPVKKPVLPTYQVVSYLNDTTKCFVAYSDSDDIPKLGSDPSTPEAWQQLGWKTGPILDQSLSLNDKLTSTFTGSDIKYNDGLEGTIIRRLNPNGTGSLYFYQLQTGNLWEQIYGKIYWAPSFMKLEIPSDPYNEAQWLANGWQEVSNVKDGWYFPDTQLANFIYEYVTPKWYIFTKPEPGTTITLKDTAVQLVYNDNEWIIPGVTEVTLPITIKATVYVDTVAISIDEIKNNIVTLLQSYFEPKFNIFAPLYRSDIIRVIQSAPHVVYCELESPDKDIIYNVDISKIPPALLIDFVPPYTYFKDIELTIVPYTAEVKS